MESRRERSARLSSISSSDSQQPVSGGACERMARADTGVTTVSGAGFGRGSGRGKGLVSESPVDILDPDHGARARGGGGEGGEGGSLGAGGLAIKAAMRFKGRARRPGGGGGDGGVGGRDGAEVATITSHAAHSLHRGLAAGSETNSKGVRSGDHLSRGASSGHVEVMLLTFLKSSLGGFGSGSVT